MTPIFYEGMAVANLLPETHLSEIGQQLKVSSQDIVGLLLRLGRDTAGAFSIGQPRRDGDILARASS
ncbi:HipA-like protein [Rhizobium sp. PP-F2F-G20b]|nr:HipA-like protein [Rhizobium sp. PP-F2F-G20b]